MPKRGAFSVVDERADHNQGDVEEEIFYISHISAEKLQDPHGHVTGLFWAVEFEDTHVSSPTPVKIGHLEQHRTWCRRPRELLMLTAS